MLEIIKFFASDLTSLLFMPEEKDTHSGFSSSVPASSAEAWHRDNKSLANDARKAIEKVKHECAIKA